MKKKRNQRAGVSLVCQLSEIDPSGPRRAIASGHFSVHEYHDRMGLELRIQSCAAADWSTIVTMISRFQLSPTLRMINGLPAFPDEVPPDDWSELRVSLPGGMITLARMPAGYRVVTWGTADPQLELDRNRLAYSLAQATLGVIQFESELLSADAFARRVGLEV